MMKIKQELLRIVEQIDNLIDAENTYEEAREITEENSNNTKVGVEEKDPVSSPQNGSKRTQKQIDAYKTNFQKRWSKKAVSVSTIYDDIC